MGRILLAVLSIGLSYSALAIPKTYDELFKSFESPNFHIVPDSECERRESDGDVGLAYLFKSKMNPADVRLQLDQQDGNSNTIFPPGFMSWVPDGVPVRQNHADCSANYIQNQLRQFSLQLGAKNDFLRKLFNRCEAHLSRNAKPAWEALARIEQATYNFCQNRQIRRLKIRLPDGHVVDAWLAMKLDSQPRPLVIVKCGIFCNPGNGSQRFLMMHYFDESPWHVLLVGNMTGAQYAHDNKIFAMGGYDEGLQFVELAQMLMAPDSPVRPYISHLHAAAVSLGSHAVLYASLYNQYYKQFDGSPLFTSFSAICPVVDMQKTFDDNFNDFLHGEVLSHVAWSAISAEMKDVFALQRLIPNGKMPDYHQFPAIMSSAAIDDYIHRPAEWRPKPFASELIDSQDKYWQINNFLDHASEVRTPVFALSSDDDILVSPEYNSKMLIADKFANQPGSSIQVLDVPKGNHCAISQYYGWDVVSAILRGMIPEVAPPPKKMMITSELIPAELKLNADEQHFSQKWKAVVNNPLFIATYQIWNPKTKDKTCKDPYTDSNDCFRQVEAVFRFSDLGLQLMVPQNLTETQALTRWANAHLQIVDSKGFPLQETQAPPAAVVVQPW